MKDTIVWFDLPVLNLERAMGFYSAVLDCKVDMCEEGGFKFAMFPHSHNCDGDNNHVSGCMYVASDRKPSTDGAVIYFDVEGYLKEATARVVGAGGKIITEVEQIGPYGYRSLIVDTEGNGVALYSKTV